MSELKVVARLKIHEGKLDEFKDYPRNARAS